MTAAPPPPAPASSPAAPGDPRRGPLLAIGAIVALGLFAYATALRGAFVFDDVKEIRDNPLIRDLASFVPGRPGVFPNRWVGYLTFALNYRLGGLATPGYHLVNVLVHVANALLVYALVRVTFRTPRLRASALAPSSVAIAGVAGAIFVAHPLESQAVAYVVQRLSSLATTFYLATVVLYARWRLRDGTGRSRLAVAAGGAAVVATALLAMRTKEIAFTLPFAVALYEVSFLDGPARLRLARLAPVLATLPVIPVTTFLATARPAGLAAGLGAAARMNSPLGRAEYLLTQLVVVVRYLGLLAFPAGQTIDHDVAVRRSLLDPVPAAALALILGLLAVALLLYRRTRPGAPRPLDPAARLAGFGICWFFLALAVESSVIPIADLMYEHRAYLPSVGPIVAVAVGLAALARRIRRADPARATALAGALLAVALSAATLARNAVWASPLSLWTDAALKAPNKPRPLMNLGTALGQAGERALAARVLRRAVALDPGSTYARAQLAAALLGLGRDGEAEAELREVLRAEPRDAEALFNLATVLWRTGRREEARGLYARFLEIAPAAYADARRLAAARAAPPGP